MRQTESSYCINVIIYKVLKIGNLTDMVEVFIVY